RGTWRPPGSGRWPARLNWLPPRPRYARYGWPPRWPATSWTCAGPPASHPHSGSACPPGGRPPCRPPAGPGPGVAGRDYVTPDDVKALARPTLRHRIGLRPEAELEGASPDGGLEALLASVPVPR